MAATNFKTENNTFRKLMGNGLSYRIPAFQRDYSWGHDEWEDLWTDILEAIDPKNPAPHYMGYLVLQSDNDKSFDVIDGQQRLTTISLIVLALMKHIQRLIDAGNNAENNKSRLAQMRQTYIGSQDLSTLVVRPKLVLNRNNNEYFKNHLVELGNLPQRGFSASVHLLRKAFEWFDKAVASWLRKNGGQDAGSQLGALMESISDQLFFTVITVTDELNAYRVFETLNARGVSLSATDLLKNYLFSIMAKNDGASGHELQEMENRWNVMAGRLQSEKIPGFLRIHWNSRQAFSRQANLFKNIRSTINTKQEAFALLRNMEEDVDPYLALSFPESSEWPQKDKKLAAVLRTFNVRQPFSLLLAARRSFSDADFSGLLRATVVISLRYNIIGTLSAGVQESIYSAAARNIARGEITTLSQALQALREIYVEDRPFKAAFSTTDSRNNRVVRYILCALEKHVGGQDWDFSSTAFNIEHVLPQKAPDGWGGFSSQEAAALLYRLGNMALLDRNANADVGNQEYPQKRAAYRCSGFATTRKISEDCDRWEPAHIAARQNWMAQQASSIWRIAQFDSC